MNETQGLDVVLTPVQLAALLEGEDFEGEGTLASRLWGAASLVGGAVGSARPHGALSHCRKS